MHLRPVVLLLALLSCGSPKPPAATASTAEPVPTAPPTHHGLAGSRLRFRLPDGFERFTRLPVFFHSERDVSIALLEGTAESADVMGAMLDGFRRKLVVADEVAITRGTAKGFERHAVLPDGKHEKMVALHDGAAFGAAILTYTDSDSEMARTVIESLSIDPAAPLDPLAIHGISLATTEGFVVNRMFTATITLIEPGPWPLPKNSPGFAIAGGPLESEEDLDAAIATYLADADQDTATLKRFDLGGLPAIEVEADLTGPKKSQRLYLLVIKEAPTRLLLGWGNWNRDRPEVRERYRKIALGMRGNPTVFGPAHLP